LTTTELNSSSPTVSKRSRAALMGMMMVLSSPVASIPSTLKDLPSMRSILLSATGCLKVPLATPLPMTTEW